MDKIRKVLINDEQLERAMKEATKRIMKKLFDDAMPPMDMDDNEFIFWLAVIGANIYEETSKLLGLSEV